MKLNSFVRRSSTEVNEPRRITFRTITPKTVSIWFSHELCFGRYTNRIRRPGSDQNACRLATDFSTPRTPFLPRSVPTSHASATSFTNLLSAHLRGNFFEFSEGLNRGFGFGLRPFPKFGGGSSGGRFARVTPLSDR